MGRAYSGGGPGPEIKISLSFPLISSHICGRVGSGEAAGSGPSMGPDFLFSPPISAVSHHFAGLKGQCRS